MEEPGAMKVKKINKRYDHATAVKRKPTSKIRVIERKWQEEKIEVTSMP